MTKQACLFFKSKWSKLMLPENSATPPDNWGHQGSTCPNSHQGTSSQRGSLYLLGLGIHLSRSTAEYGQETKIKVSDRMLETEKADVVSGAHEISLEQAEMEGQAGHSAEPGAVRQTAWGSARVQEWRVNTELLWPNKTKNPTTKQTRAENQVRETPPECPLREEMIELKEQSILHRS